MERATICASQYCKRHIQERHIAAYLVWTGDDLGELAFLLILAFDDSFNDGRVVAPEVHEDVGYAILP
jgi:hypothetical protein